MSEDTTMLNQGTNTGNKKINLIPVPFIIGKINIRKTLSIQFYLFSFSGESPFQSYEQWPETRRLSEQILEFISFHSSQLILSQLVFGLHRSAHTRCRDLPAKC